MFPVEDEEDAGPIVPAGVHLAPFGRRALGLLVDELVVGLPVFAVFLAVGVPLADLGDDNPAFWLNVSLVATGLVYDTLGVWRWGRTVGKLVARTRVVHVADGGSVAFSAALMRALVPAAFGVIPQIGPFLGFGVYLLAFLDPRRQGLHDKAAGTLVGMSTVPV